MLLLCIALYSSALLADQHQSTVGQLVTLGTSNKYTIGTSDNPVLATEYCQFLNYKAPSDDPWFESNYYDSSFINTSNNWSFENNPNACIYRTGKSGGYSYSVLSGHENDIITAVYYVGIQQKFSQWRDQNAAAAAAAKAAYESNPTRQELCDYINDEIAGKLDPSYLEKAQEIKNRYPQAAVLTRVDVDTHFATPGEIVWYTSDTPMIMQTLWDQVDALVSHIYGYDVTDSTLRSDDNSHMYTTITHYAASDAECNHFIARWGLVFSNENDASLNFPASMPKHALLLEGVNQDDRQAWATEFPDPPVVKFDYPNIITLSDTAVVTKVPYHAAPTTEAKN